MNDGGGGGPGGGGGKDTDDESEGGAGGAGWAGGGGGADEVIGSGGVTGGGLIDGTGGAMVGSAGGVGALNDGIEGIDGGAADEWDVFDTLFTLSSSTTYVSSLLLLISFKNGKPPDKAGALFVLFDCFPVEGNVGGGGGPGGGGGGTAGDWLLATDGGVPDGNGGADVGSGGADMLGNGGGAVGINCFWPGLFGGIFGFDLFGMLSVSEEEIDGTGGAVGGIIGGAAGETEGICGACGGGIVGMDGADGGDIVGMDGADGGDIVGIDGAAGGLKFIEFLFGLPDGTFGNDGADIVGSLGFVSDVALCLSLGIPPANISPNCGGPPIDGTWGAPEEKEGIAGAPIDGPLDDDELDELPITGADLSFVTAFFKWAPFLISPSKAFLSGVTLGNPWAGGAIAGGIPGGGGGGGGGVGPMMIDVRQLIVID